MNMRMMIIKKKTKKKKKIMMVMLMTTSFRMNVLEPRKPIAVTLTNANLTCVVVRVTLTERSQTNIFHSVSVRHQWKSGQWNAADDIVVFASVASTAMGQSTVCALKTGFEYRFVAFAVSNGVESDRASASITTRRFCYVHDK